LIKDEDPWRKANHLRKRISHVLDRFVWIALKHVAPFKPTKLAVMFLLQVETAKATLTMAFNKATFILRPLPTKPSSEWEQDFTTQLFCC